MHRSRVRQRTFGVVLASALLVGLVPVAAAVDDVPPETVIYAGPSGNTSPYVAVAFRGAPADDVDHLECRLDGGPWVVPCPDPWVMTLPGGPHQIDGRAVDAAGNADATPAEVIFFVDDVGPLGSVTINDGAATTARPIVHLALPNTDRDDPAIRVSNSPELDEDGHLAEAWEGYQWQLKNSAYGWRLDDERYGGTSGPGTKTVYVEWTDQFGNVGPIVSDTIELTPGITAVSIRLGPTENPVTQGELAGVRAVITAADGSAIRDGSAVMICPGDDDHQNGRGEPKLVLECYGADWPVGVHDIQVEFRDSSELANAFARFDLTVRPPTSLPPLETTLSVQGGYLFPETVIGTIQLETSRPATAHECRIDEGAWATCSATWTVANPGTGDHRLEARSRDAAGVWGPVSEPARWHIGDSYGWYTHLDLATRTWASTNQPTSDVYLYPGPGALAARLSASPIVDANGRLAHALEVPSPTYSQKVSFDVEDPATGGTPGDGRKWFTVQFQQPDGAWSTPFGFSFMLDRVAPSLRLVVNAAVPWVDGDDVLLLPKTEKWAAVAVSEDPDIGYVHPGTGIMGIDTWSFQGIAPGEVATRTIYARAADLAGNQGTIVSATITIDRSVPVSSLSAPTFVVGSAVSTRSIPIRVAGSTKDTGSGVASSSLQEAAATNGAFKTVATAKNGSTSVVRTVDPALARAYRVRGLDRLGHVGAWKVGPVVDPYLVDDAKSTVKASTGWRRVARTYALGGRVLSTSTAGATVTFAFRGRAVAIVAPRSTSLGRFAVYVDGKYVRSVDLRASSTQARRVVFAQAWSTAGSHTIRLKALSTPGRRTVMIDGFAVMP